MDTKRTKRFEVIYPLFLPPENDIIIKHDAYSFIINGLLTIQRPSEMYALSTVLYDPIPNKSIKSNNCCFFLYIKRDFPENVLRTQVVFSK